MKLNGRLSMIAGMIPHCGILSDIGTDHAYIPIYAVGKGLCSKALAADLREGPLKMADANIRRHGLGKNIETRLGSGLGPISLEECEIIVIAGMGGTLIRDILSDSLEKSKRTELLLLQPNNAADVLRKWLYENGFEISREMLAFDAGKLYCLISTKWTGKVSIRDEFDYYIGDVLLNSRDPNLYRYIEKKIRELDVVIAGRQKSKAERHRDFPGKPSLISCMDTSKCMDIRNKLKEFQEMTLSKGLKGITTTEGGQDQ